MHGQTDLIEPHILFKHGHNFVAGNGIVRTRPQNMHGVIVGKRVREDDSVTVIVPIFDWVGCFDVIDKILQQA